MIKNEINAHNAALLSYEAQCNNLKENIERIYTEIKKAIEQGQYCTSINIRNSMIYIDIDKFIWIVKNILMSQGYHMYISKTYYHEFYVNDFFEIIIYW